MMEKTIIKKWDPNSPSYARSSLFSVTAEEKPKNSSQASWHFLVSQSAKLVLAQSLMQISMSRLEKEFFQILSSNRDQLDPESVSSHSSVSSSSEFEDVMQSDDDEDELKKAGESISQVEKASALVMSDLKVIAESYFKAPILEDEHINNHMISAHLAWLILVFLYKLDIKAESYKDVSLSYLFLVNNIQFLVDTVRSTDHLSNLLGDGWPGLNSFTYMLICDNGVVSNLGYQCF